MNKPDVISSLQNPLVKQVIDLQAKSRSRHKHRKFIVEGINEIRLCFRAGYDIEKLIFCEQNISAAALISDLSVSFPEEKLVRVSPGVFDKIAYREDVKNAIAIVAMKDAKLEEIPMQKKAIFLVAEGIEKPGNLGAILRSADAMGATAVLLAQPKCDIYNPNVIRGSVGSVFALPIISCSNEEALDFLKKNKVQIYTTFMESSEAAWDTVFEEGTAIAVGTESTGLSDFWKKNTHRNINIPMFGKVDSLNVSVAVSLLLYEVARQLRN